MRLLALLLLTSLLSACDLVGGAESCLGQGPEVVVVRTTGEVVRSFPVEWGALGRQAPRVARVRVAALGERYLYLGMDRVGRIYDLETGALVRDVTYERELSTDPYRARLLEAAYPLDRYTFPGGPRISGLHPAWAELRAVSPRGATEVLVRDTSGLLSARHVAFSHPRQSAALANGDVLFARNRYEIVVTPDSLGTTFYQAYYRRNWSLFRYDARTGREESLMRLPGEPLGLTADSAGSVATATFNTFDDYVLDLRKRTARLWTDPPILRAPSPDGRYVLGEEYDHAAVVLDRVTEEVYPLGGGDGRFFGMVAWGPGSAVYASRTQPDTLGVFRIPPSATGFGNAWLVWRPNTSGRGRDELSAPVFLNDSTFVVLHQFHAYCP